MLHCRLASKVTDFCWNGDYTPPSIPIGVPDLFTLVMEAESTDVALACPSSPDQVQQLQLHLRRLALQLSGASNGLVQDIVWKTYTPSLCQAVGVEAMAAQLISSCSAELTQQARGESPRA